MKSSDAASEAKENLLVQSKIDDFFDHFRIGTLLHRCGIRKRHGYSVRSLIQTIFMLPFVGKNFFRGIVINNDCEVGKDAAYDILKSCTFNWRQVLLTLGVRMYCLFNRLTSDQRQSVLIIDDSTYDRSRSKKVELLSRVFDHSTGRHLRGFRLLTLSWSDGVSCLPLDFALLSSTDPKKRFCESQKSVDKRSCAYQRRREATMKATEHLEAMVERVLKGGVSAKYILMDRWFTMPANISKLRKHLDVIGMVKKTEKIFYEHEGRKRDLVRIYQKIRKRPGRSQILASTVVTMKDKQPAKLVFIRDRRKSDWLALLTTDIHLPDDEVVRIYGKRWDIEVLFKMTKQHLKLAKEIQCRDFDALIAHTTIVFMRHMFVSYRVRMESDDRTFGELFYACCDEVSDINFVEALHRLLTLALEQLREMGSFCKKTAQAFFDLIIDNALSRVNLPKYKMFTKNA